MTKPKAYEPEYGYRYQILVRFQDGREYEHLDYAKDSTEKNYLLNEYHIAYHGSAEFLPIQLPRKYWEESWNNGTTI